MLTSKSRSAQPCYAICPLWATCFVSSTATVMKVTFACQLIRTDTTYTHCLTQPTLGYTETATRPVDASCEEKRGVAMQRPLDDLHNRHWISATLHGIPGGRPHRCGLCTKEVSNSRRVHLARNFETPIGSTYRPAHAGKTVKQQLLKIKHHTNSL